MIKSMKVFGVIGVSLMGLSLVPAAIVVAINTAKAIDMAHTEIQQARYKKRLKKYIEEGLKDGRIIRINGVYIEVISERVKQGA